MSKFKSLLVAATLLSCMANASAGILADVVVLDRNTGERLRTWNHEGRLYVAGQPGHRYSVEVSNRSGRRLLAVLAVDGVNAVSGETASTGDTGYVLDAGQKTAIAGWRKNLGEVASFYFTRLPDSYAARTGRPDNVGVIGVALYREYGDDYAYRYPDVAMLPPDMPPMKESRSMSAAAPASRPSARVDLNRMDADRAPAEQRLGTGHGERVVAASHYTEFRRATIQPAEIIAIYYDSHANLVAKGVIPRYLPWLPLPFPGRFVPDPS